MLGLIKAISATSALLLCSTASIAGTVHATHTTNPITLTKWSQKITSLVERRLEYPASPMIRPEEGIVTVKFLCSEAGRPSEVKLLKSSGFKRLDNAALKAVRQVASLHPLPQGMKSSQNYQAMILFARDQFSYNRQIAKFRREALERNKWFGNKPPQIALGVGLLDESLTSDEQVAHP